MATVITPNQFECELLTGIKIRTSADIVRTFAHFHALGIPTVIITSLEDLHDSPFDDPDMIYMVASQQQQQQQQQQHAGGGGAAAAASEAQAQAEPDMFMISVPRIPAYFTGTGDLTAAMLLAWLHNSGGSIVQAMEHACATIQAVLARTWSCIQEAEAAGDASKASKELRLIQSAGDIVKPQIKVRAQARCRWRASSPA